MREPERWEVVRDLQAEGRSDSIMDIITSRISYLITKGCPPDKAVSITVSECTDPNGNIYITKGQVRTAASEALNLIKGLMRDDFDGKVVITQDLSMTIIPTEDDEHISVLKSEVESWENLEGMGFGIYELDLAYGGLYPGETMAVVGAPGSMKTSLALNAVDDYLSRYKSKVLFFSLDMPARTIQARRLMREMDCFQYELYEAIKRRDPAVEDARQRILERDNGRFKLIGKPKGGKHYSWENIRDMTIQVAPELVIIDYLTLIGQYRSELEAVYDLIPKIKGMADDFGIAVILLSQMGRGSRAAQKTASGGHAAGGHYVEDAVDIEIELLKEETEDEQTAIVATVTKTRKNQSGGNFRLGFIPRTLAFKSTASRVARAKAPTKIFDI